GLQYAMECAKQKEVCLYFTSMRPKDLMIHAASNDFDLQQYMNQNLIIVVRVAPPSDLYEVGNPDEFLVEYLNDIVTVVDQYQPNKIVFDELTPFIGFENINLLSQVFLRTTESIEENGITSLFILGDPATPAAKNVVDVLAENATGIIYLQKKEGEERATGGKITITPNIGHTEGQFTSNYYIEPYKGVTVEMTGGPKNSSYFTPVPPKADYKYRALSDIELPAENYSVSNLYNFNDFSLILNNQIALFKSTGQVFSIVSFRLDPSAEKKGLLTINQLQNAVRLSTDRKDKICIISNKVVVLITKDDQKTINSLIVKMKANLPGNDNDYLARVTQYLSVFIVKMDDTIQSAEDIIKQVMSDEIKEQNKLGFY
ncbi:MAG: ATPase domain-containing protein, partial [Ignavibacteriaceae bacterium]